MSSTWYVRLGAILLVLGSMGCRQTPAYSSAQGTTAAPQPRVAMDSAEIERLCAQPDSVRMGLTDCVLKDQSVRPRRPPR